VKHRSAPLASVALLLLGCGSEVQGGGSGGRGGTGGHDAGAGAHDAGTGGHDAATGGGEERCSEPAVSGVFEPGAYFFVVELEAPLPTQLQLWAWFDVDRELVRFTNADRNPGPTCGCPDDDGCSSVGTEPCVLPSAKAGTEDEYSDFLVLNAGPPEGYSFATSVCTADQPDGTVTFTAAPVDVEIEQPPVTLVATRLSAECAADVDGVLRCSGSIEADQVLLGTANSGAGRGTLVARAVPEGEAPANLPKP
jgi:hypothetical protein